MTSYIIRAARDEETSSGWVWMAMLSRTIVRISREGRWVFCEVRDIRDQNFIDKYNSDSKRSQLKKNLCDETIVMAKWYRDALGGFRTTQKDNTVGRKQLDVIQPRLPGWRSLRAACHHPDSVVRLGARLGVLGAWLGIVGLMPQALSAFGVDDAHNRWISSVLALLVGAASIFACRGVRRLCA